MITPNFTSSANPTLPGSAPVKSPVTPPAFNQTDWTLAFTGLTITTIISTYHGQTDQIPDSIEFQYKLSTDTNYSDWAPIADYAQALPYSGDIVTVEATGTYNMRIRAVIDGIPSALVPKNVTLS